MTHDNPEAPDPNEWECWLDEGHLWGVGHITQLNQKASRKRKHPLGFAAPKGRQRKTGDRPPGTFPDVPYFDEIGH